LNKALQSHITAELIEGNIKAFEAVFNNYYHGLIYFATSYLRNREDANDIIQSVFLTLWERRATLQPNTNLTAYLFTNTRNQCLNYLNHLKAKSNYLSFQEHNWNDLQLNIYALEEFNPSGLEYEELEKKLQKALDSMSEDCARIFRMSRFDGLKYSDIADKLQISVKTVEKKMSIALAHLRNELKVFYFLLFISRF
jgi:RNA polymerase sigma-70 factor (ECF subfamily)